MTAIAERVAAGAAFLDEHVPGWDPRIDVATLKLSSPCRCILGQLWKEDAPADPYVAGRIALGLRWPRTIHLGFDEDLARQDYAALTAEWKRVITARREAAP